MQGGCFMKKKTVFIAEDDRVLADKIGTFLQKWGMEPLFPRGYRNLDEQILNQNPDMVLMDVRLPEYDGYYWTRKIRQISDVPVLFISSLNEDQDIIMAIVQGGDDYLIKPFRLELLKAKMDALFRRTGALRMHRQVELGQNLFYLPDQCEIISGQQKVSLTGSEKKVMDLLSQKAPRPVSRDELMMALWQTDEYISDGTLTTCISRLRSKIKKELGVDLIETRKGVGYCIPYE